MANANFGAVPTVGRKMRSPVHHFNLRHMPFQIQPFMIAPVIPGETMKNALVQSRVVTDPIKNKLIGWWMEYYFFYVKHRDLDDRDDFTAMMLDLTYDLSHLNEAAAVKYNHYAGTINWAKLCLKRVVETHFREEGEAWDAYMIDGLPAGAMNRESWLQSADLNDAYTVDNPEITVGVDDKITGQEIDLALQTWQFQRANNLTAMSYEDWLGTYGIRTPRVELHRPEVLRYIREWQYPSNTINPEDGSAASAVSWAISDRLDKDRFFTEPGFIFGVTVARPKMYIKNIDGSGVGMLNNALSWLPALMRDDPWTSMKKFAHNEGPLATIVTDTDGYWVDVKDLFLYGDDFVNFARSETGEHMLSVPGAGLVNKYYPGEGVDVGASVDDLFTGTTDAARMVRQDGIVKLSILGAQVDTTPIASRGS